MGAYSLGELQDGTRAQLQYGPLAALVSCKELLQRLPCSEGRVQGCCDIRTRSACRERSSVLLEAPGYRKTARDPPRDLGEACTGLSRKGCSPSHKAWSCIGRWPPWRACSESTSEKRGACGTVASVPMR
ncbi:hypothetical protein NDU88_002362 [Pleurodeles waltl]|uniref:Uncharacterized protein n=1 Tax=Pleurodeles waltl TaxID=8319 RepID=A0AAV7M198_PLEWA|nr:hypothetical protein NDU88_002362 [Pleurodeles waltl]